MFTIKTVKEVPTSAMVSRGRKSEPTQFDDSPLKVGQIYEIDVTNAADEIELLKEARRWAKKQRPELSVRVSGRVPQVAAENVARTVYLTIREAKHNEAQA